MSRYTIHEWGTNGTVKEYCIVDSTVYPKDTTTYLKDHIEWYRKEMLESFKIVRFPVHARQAAPEALKRARTYVDYLNREDDAIQIATKLVTI